MAVLASTWLLTAGSLAAFAGVFLLMALGMTQLAPLTDASVLSLLESRPGHAPRAFGRSRLFGSIGFALAALLFGAFLRKAAPERTATAAMQGVFFLSLLAAGLAWTTSSEGRGGANPRLAELKAVLECRGVKPLLLTGALQWVTLSPYHAFFGEHVQHHGGSAAQVGLGIAVAVAVEILVMATAPRWLSRFDTRSVLAVSSLVGVVRWSLTALCSPGWMVVAQAFHGLSYGAFFLALVDEIVRRTPSALRGTATGLTAGLAIGGGTLVGSLLAGELYAADFGRLLFLATAGFSVVPAAAALTIPPLTRAPALTPAS